MTIHNILIQSIIWIIAIYNLAKIIQSKVLEKRYECAYEQDIPRVLPYKFKIIITILVILLLIIIPLEIDYSLVLIILFVRDVQKNKIYSNGISTKENFYLWSDINQIILPKNSFLLELNINKRNIFDKKVVTIPVASNRYKEIIKMLEEKPISFKK